MKHSSYLIFLFFLAGIADAKHKRRRVRIIGGENAEINRFPYQASIRLRGNHFCGGTIVSNKHIVTSAHCITADFKPPFSVVSIHTGTSSIEEVGTVHRISKVTVHPGWSGNRDLSFAFDLAVIAIADAITFNAQQNKVKLPTSNAVTGQIGVVTGWGFTAAGKASKTLQKLDMTLLTNVDCQKSHKRKIYPNQICAVHRQGHKCSFGDSGSPIVVGNELKGIVSWAEQGCQTGLPDVFANVFSQKGFIETSMNKL